jgi:Adenosine-deaminase (editase) domain
LNEPIVVLLKPKFSFGRYLLPDANNSCGHSVVWNLSETPKISTIIGKFGLKQGANIKNPKTIKSSRSDICNYEMLKAFVELFQE